MKYFLLVFPVLAFKLCGSAGEQCIQSIPTIRDVPFCPRNKEEWISSAKKKGCEAMAKIQTCEKDPELFVYHCLVNQWKNGTVEVCAPKWFLTGYCGFYDTVMGKIVNDVKKDCTKFKNPCPLRYNSSDLYEYQECYIINKVPITDRTCSGPKCDSSEKYYLVGMVIAIVICISLIIVLVKNKVTLDRKRKTDKDDIEFKKLEKTEKTNEGSSSVEICTENAEPSKQESRLESRMPGPSNEAINVAKTVNDNQDRSQLTIPEPTKDFQRFETENNDGHYRSNERRYSDPEDLRKTREGSEYESDTGSLKEGLNQKTIKKVPKNKTRKKRQRRKRGKNFDRYDQKESLMENPG